MLLLLDIGGSINTPSGDHYPLRESFIKSSGLGKCCFGENVGDAGYMWLCSTCYLLSQLLMRLIARQTSKQQTKQSTLECSPLPNFENMWLWLSYDWFRYNWNSCCAAAPFYDIVVIVGHIRNLLHMLYIDTPSDCLRVFCKWQCICACVCVRGCVRWLIYDSVWGSVVQTLIITSYHHTLAPWNYVAVISVLLLNGTYRHLSHIGISST